MRCIVKVLSLIIAFGVAFAIAGFIGDAIDSNFVTLSPGGVELLIEKVESGNMTSASDVEEFTDVYDRLIPVSFIVQFALLIVAMIVFVVIIDGYEKERKKELLL
jgi:hypothetical protein